jgi:hypothetical protein
VAKGADCKSKWFAFWINGHSEKNGDFRLLSNQRLSSRFRMPAAKEKFGYWKEPA